MTSDPLVVSHPAEIRAVLSDSRFTVAPVPRPPFAPTVAWLRGAVGRFAEGTMHAERRAAGVAVLAGLDPGALRAEAFRLASRDIAPLPCPLEQVPVLVLAIALGVRAEDGPSAVRAVAAIAPAYLPGVGAGPGEEEGGDVADKGLVELSRLLGDPPPERLAVLAGLLAQACAPTVALVRSALAAAAARFPAGAGAGPVGPHPAEAWTVEELLDETLRHDPPVRTLRRRAPGDGRLVILDVTAAGRDLACVGGETEYLTFGAGPRACPGRRVALALAAGTIEAATR
ncbi:hypothetical protein [Streptosporangium sp. NPDC006930]|uniref:hypothetical protein n=1 Tax=unclassified Streptosporangium TaxID=2632669 RepID=UPI00343BA9E1